LNGDELGIADKIILNQEQAAGNAARKLQHQKA